MPNYPQWRVHPDYTGKIFFREQHKQVKILRSWMFIPKRVTSISRIGFEVSFLVSSLIQAIRNSKPDLLLVVSPPLCLGLSAVLLSRLWSIPYIFDVQDLQPDAAADLKMIPRPILPMLYSLERTVYRHASLIVTVTQGMRRRIICKGIPGHKVVAVPPPADQKLFEVGNIVTGEDFRGKHCLQGKFIVAHSGNMGVKQGLDVVLDTALQMRERKDIVFLLAGDGVMKSHLQRRASSLGIATVRFFPVQEETDYLQMLAAVDMGLIVQQASVSDILFPSKSVTLLSAGRPVGASVSADSEIGRVILQSGGGLLTEPENPNALALAVEELFNHPKKRFSMGESGRQYALQHWERNRVLSGFESHLLRTLAVG